MPRDHDRLKQTLRLAGLGLSAMLVPLGSTMIAVALPAIGSEFSRTPSELTQWLVTTYLVATILALAPAGKLGDRWGHRNTMRLGQVLFGVGCLLPLVFHAFAALVASRVLMAVGGAMLIPTVMAVIRLTVPADRRHRVFGYFGAMMSFAAALGPTLGGLLVHHFGWVAIFVMNLPPLVLSAFFAASYFRGELPSEAHKPSVPIARAALFSHRSFAAGCAMVALQNLAMYALLFQLPFLLSALFQWKAERAGYFMTAFMVSMMAGSALGGRVAESIGVRATCIAGSLASMLGVYGLSTIGPGNHELYVIAALVLGGGGLGLANGPTQSAALGSVDRASSGVASGVLSTSRYIGGVVGISILGTLISGPGSAASLGQHQGAVVVFAGAFLAAAAVSMLLPGRAKRD
jgi:MFS family permease